MDPIAAQQTPRRLILRSVDSLHLQELYLFLPPVAPFTNMV